MNYEIKKHEEETTGERVTLTEFERSPKLAEIKAVYKSRKRAEERPTIRRRQGR